uniref:hypothetical protein n=1 Tax=Clostridium sp. 12(A) TaxID=1163671 RepID=UPI00046724BA|nr:hypothetical protein [Clostridium sp. 12(A)]
MSKVYLDNGLYVKTPSNLIYKTESIEMYDSTSYLTINLILVAGYNYINTDENDIQGYVSASNFVDGVQDETVVQYFMVESMKQCLIDNGYEILDTLPMIH